MTRILAVEDSPTQAEKLRSDLLASGFDVTIVSRAREALSLLESEPAGSFDIVLSDVVMPDMDGYELCRAVKSSAVGQTTPVVLLTTLTDPLEVVKGLEAGADNFIRKPYRATQLADDLMSTLRSAQAHSGSRLRLGIQLSFLSREFEITADRQPILDLLVSTFDELVTTTREVRAREDELIHLHHEVEQQLRMTQIERNRLKTVLDSVPVPVVVTDRDGTITHVSRAAAEAFETTVESMTGRGCCEVITFEDPDGAAVPAVHLPFAQSMKTGEHAEMGTAFDLLLPRRDGTRVPVVLQASPVLDDTGQATGSVSAAHVLGAVSQHDPITGLPNRAAFIDRIGAALMTPHQQTAVLLLGLDRLDEARGTAGESPRDDAPLKAAARHLRHAVEESRGVDDATTDVLLAYLGGDQFGIVLSGPAEHLGALRLANQAHSAVSRWAKSSFGVRVTASVGASLAGSATDAPRLLAAAGAALRRARTIGGDRIEIFDPVASEAAVDRLRLDIDLREAIGAGTIDLEYQPEVDLRTGEILGFEALARWRHKDRGVIPPDVFVGIAEESGLILSLGQHVLEAACRQIRSWRAGGLLGRGQAVSVNLSTVQLRPELVGEVQAVLSRTGVDAQDLMLEVTETTAMKDPKATIAIIDRLRSLGVRFSLDDFGTGYSSLAYLSRIRFDQLKLDRTFVGGITEDGPDTMIAQSVIAIGHSLGIQVIAEGIEQEGQVDVLRALGCDQGQGYYFSRPLSAAKATELLAARHRDDDGPFPS